MGLVTFLAPDDQDVAKPVGGQERSGTALALDDRVGRHGGGMEDGVEFSRRDARLAQEPLESRDNCASRIVRAAGNLEEPRRSVRPRQDEVRERATDVERHSPHGCRPFLYAHSGGDSESLPCKAFVARNFANDFTLPHDREARPAGKTDFAA